MNMDIESSRVLLHPERVSEWKARGDCYPIYVEIGPTNSCNHHCVFCSLEYVENKGDFIDKDILNSALRDMGGRVKSVMFAGEGEPTLHKDIGFFAETARKAGIDVSITTNGVPFNTKKIKSTLPYLSWIRFSVDSGSPENYSLVHGTNPRDFNRVIENIKESVTFKKENGLRTTIATQFLMIPQNINEGTILAGKLKEIMVDNLQVKPYSYHPKSSHNLLVDPKKYNSLERDLLKYNTSDFKVLFRSTTAKRIHEGINYPECYGLPFFALIDAKGNVLPCNLFYGQEEFAYGNLYESSFLEIWEGDKRKDVLKKLKQIGTKNCRNGCRLDPTNRDLHRIKNPFPHDNFL